MNIDLKKQYQIIVVDDDPNIVEIIDTVLSEEGYIIKKAYSGKEAIETVKNNKRVKQLVLLDYYLPDMACADVIAEFGENVFFISMTAYGSEEMVLEMLKAGAKEYIVKSGKFKILLPQIIERVIFRLEQEMEWGFIEKDLNTAYSVLERSSEMVAITDLQGRITYVNSQFRKITGYKENKMGLAATNVFGAHSVSHNREIWEAMSEGRPWKGIIYNKKEDQRLYCEDAFIYPVKDSENTITHFVKIAEEVPDKRVTEKKGCKENGVSFVQDQLLSSLRLIRASAEKITDVSKKGKDAIGEILVEVDRIEDLLGNFF